MPDPRLKPDLGLRASWRRGGFDGGSFEPARALNDPEKAIDAAIEAGKSTDWDLPGWDSFVGRRGYDCDLYPATICACQRASGQSQGSCQWCGGRGKRLEEPTRIKALLDRGEGGSEADEIFGAWERGEAVVTVKRGVRIAEGFHFVFVSEGAVQRANENVKVGRDPRSMLHFAFGTKLIRAWLFDSDSYKKLQEVDAQLKVVEFPDPRDTAQLIQRRSQLASRADVDITESVKIIDRDQMAMIEWSDDRVKEGDTVSVEYDHSPQFVAHHQLSNPDVDNDQVIVRHLRVFRYDPISKQKGSRVGPGVVPHGMTRDI